MSLTISSRSRSSRSGQEADAQVTPTTAARPNEVFREALFAVTLGVGWRAMSVTSEALDEVRLILREVLGEGTAAIYLFGSWARGEATSLSDIDLAVEARVPLAPGTLARLRERLEESRVPYRVEVVDLNAVDPAFRRRVLAEGIRWSD